MESQDRVDALSHDLNSKCSLLVLEPSNGADGLLTFLHEELKDDLEEGKIGRILGVVKRYFPDSPSTNSDDDECGSAPSSPRSQDSCLSTSYYQSMYEELNKIGKGGYGHVFECRHILDGMTYAVKKIPFSDANMDQVIREVKIMAQLQHPNIIRYYHSWVEEGCEPSTASEEDSLSTNISNPPTKTLYVAMEFCHGTLEDRMESPLDEGTTYKYFTQMAEGLRHIHKKGIVHRDVSKQNIMLDTNGDIKILDFGFAIFFDGAADGSSTTSTSGPVGNPSYRAPEMTRSPTYINQKTDVFALGLVMLEMVHPMRTQSERAQMLGEIRNDSFDWSRINLGPYGFIRNLLKQELSERYSAEQVWEECVE